MSPEYHRGYSDGWNLANAVRKIEARKLLQLGMSQCVICGKDAEGNAPRIPTFDECYSHPAVKLVFSQRDELLSMLKDILSDHIAGDGLSVSSVRSAIEKAQQ